MNTSLLERDHQDALREIVNIAMGRAGAILSDVFDSFVTLSVPEIGAGPASQVIDDATQAEVTLAVRQAFRDQLEGEALVIFEGNHGPSLSDLVGLEHGGQAELDQEAVLEVGNMLVGACVNGIGEILGTRISFAPPLLWSKDAPRGSDDVVLIIGTTFQIAERSLKQNVFIALPQHSLPQLTRSISKFIELL